MRNKTIKAACHMHSDWSYDGKWPLVKLASFFERRGYRAILTTEHDRGFSEKRLAEYRKACARVSSDRIFICPGIEYSDRNNTVHTMVWGSVPFLGEGLPTMEILKLVKRWQGVAVLAHPSRLHAWKWFDPEWAPLVSGIELWNRKADGWAPSRHAASLIKSWSKMPFAGLDFHEWKQTFPLSMLLEIDSNLGENSIINSFTSGTCTPDFYGINICGKRFDKLLPLFRLAEIGRRFLAKNYRNFKSTIS